MATTQACGVICLLLITAHASFQGSLRGNSAIDETSSTSGKEDLEADANAVLMSDGTEMISRGSKGHTREAQAEDSSAAEVDSADADSSDATDKDLQSDLAAETSMLRDDLTDGADLAGDKEQNDDDNRPDDSKYGSDQLQDEVNDLQDENAAIESAESDGVQLAGLDDSNLPSHAGGDDTQQPVDIPDGETLSDPEYETFDPSETQDTANEDFRNDTALLQNMVNFILEEAHSSNQSVSHQDSPPAEELITVLIQTMKKHSRIFGSHSSRKSNAHDEMPVVEDDEDAEDNTNDADDGDEDDTSESSVDVDSEDADSEDEMGDEDATSEDSIGDEEDE